MQGEEIVLPYAIRISLDELSAFGAGSDANPRHVSTFFGVEGVRVQFDVPNNVFDSVFPSTSSVRLRPARMCNMLVGTVSVWLVDAVDSVVSHSFYLFLRFGEPVRSTGSLIFEAGPTRVMRFKHA